MYAKLFRGNIRKALRDYLVYFFTLVVSSTLFFAFLSLTSRYNDILGGDGNYSLALFQDTIRYAVLAVSFIFIVLVRYINNHMLRQRSREFSVYMILGMEQRTVAGQFFRETFVMGMAAVLSGCVFGTMLSGVMTLFAMKMVGRPASFRLGLYPDTMLMTCLFFGAAFVLVGAFNARRICRLKLIDLLNEKKAGEGQGMGKRKYVFSFIVALLCFGVDAVALYNFSGMNGVYAGDIPAEVSNLYQAVAILAAVIGIFSFYHAVLFVLSLIRRGGKLKNRGMNSVLLGSLFQKISSTAKVLSISTLAVTVAFVAFVVLPTLAEITTGYLEYRMPYHVMIYNTYRYIDEMDDIPQIDFSFVGEILRRYGIEISEEVTQESYFVWERDFNTVDTREHWRDLPRLAMGISDYNRMREMAGFPLVPLGENEFFMHLDYEMDMEEMAGSIRTRTLELDDGTQLGLAETAVYNEPLGKYLFNSDGSILVFPDDVCGRLHLARTCYYANTQTAVPYGDCNVIRDEINAAFRENYGYLFERYEEKYQSDRHYVSFIDPIRFWTQENNDVVLTAVSVRLLGIYAGTIFFIICMTVLALHLITDSIDFSAQYRTLHQIGVEREDIAGMVSRKSFCYFFVPCITAFIIALSVIYSFAVRYGHKILTYMGTSGFQFGVLIPGLLVATVLVCYYGITIYAIKRNLTVTLDLQGRGHPQ